MIDPTAADDARAALWTPPTRPQRTPDQQQLLERLFGRISDVSTLPTAAMQIVQVAADDRSAASDLLRVVESDPALASRILRAVNSSCYGLRHKVSNLKNAITLLGFREVRNLALTVYVARLFRQTSGYRCYTRQGLWDHLVGVATAARLLANVSAKAPPDDAYVAGLLHDLGYLLIDQQVQKRFRQIIDELEEGVPTYALEWRLLTFDHCELGAFVAQRWRFPQGVVEAIRYHHQPERCSDEQAPLVAAVALGDYLCNRKGLTSLGVCNVSPPTGAVFGALGIQQWQLPLIWERLEETLGTLGELAVM